MKSRGKITKDMLVGEIAQRFPKAAELLAFEYGFHCLGCAASGMETLAQGAMVHGMTEKEIEELVKTLNQVEN